MRRFATVLAFILTAASLFAADDPPRFFIERIDVRNTHHASPTIIRAETRLVEGREYTEADLREASYRVARLPFVLDAQYSLEKGSRRDAYVFVITVKETKPLFYQADLLGTFVHVPTGSGHDQINLTTGSFALGGRWFSGTSGVFHAAVGKTQPISNENAVESKTVQAGYTRYDLFGTRAFATLDLSSELTDRPHTDTTPTLTALLGVPLTGNQTLTFSAGGAYGGGWTNSGGFHRSYSESLKLATVSWAYNTTNSPFFPTRGELISATVQRSQRHQSTSNVFIRLPDGSLVPLESRYSLNTAELSGEKHWELSGRDSISATLRAELDRSTNRNTAFGTLANTRSTSEIEQVLFGYSHSLFDEKTTRARGDSRLEAYAALARTAYRYDAPFHSHYSRTAPAVTLSWARRNTWGLLRLGVSYSWW